MLHFMMQLLHWVLQMQLYRDCARSRGPWMWVLLQNSIIVKIITQNCHRLSLPTGGPSPYDKNQAFRNFSNTKKLNFRHFQIKKTTKLNILGYKIFLFYFFVMFFVEAVFSQTSPRHWQQPFCPCWSRALWFWMVGGLANQPFTWCCMHFSDNAIFGLVLTNAPKKKENLAQLLTVAFIKRNAFDSLHYSIFPTSPWPS